MISQDRNRAIENLFYGDLAESSNWRSIVDQLRNAEELHHALSFYNWDDGFELPQLILERPDCDLGTIMFLFELVGSDPEDPQCEFAEYEADLAAFVAKLVARHRRCDYTQSISHAGSSGEELIVERAPGPSHYDVFPEELDGEAG